MSYFYLQYIKIKLVNKKIYKSIFRHIWFRTIPWKYRFKIFFQVLNILIFFFPWWFSILRCLLVLKSLSTNQRRSANISRRCSKRRRKKKRKRRIIMQVKCLRERNSNRSINAKSHLFRHKCKVHWSYCM